MRRARLPSGAILLILFAMEAGCGRDRPTPYADEPGAARDVLDLAYGYADGGGYLLRDTGVPEDVRHDGTLILPRDPRGTYCCGFTFTVAMRAAAGRGLLKGKTVEQVRTFQKEWYGAIKGTAERQAALAVEHLGVGREVRWSDAAPGDFVVYSGRHGGGHSVVFLQWLKRNDRIIGMRYRSSQSATRGVGDATNYFEGSGLEEAELTLKHFHVARLN